MGAHDMDMNEIISKSAVRGGWSAGATLGIGMLFAGAKGLANFRSGRLFTKDDAIDAGIPVKDADKAIEEANKLLPKGKEIKPTLAQKGDDVLVESSEAELRGRSEYAQRFRERDVANIEGEQAALERIGAAEVKPYAPKTVGDVAGERVARRVAQGEAVVARNQAQLDARLGQIGKVQKETVGADTLAILKEKDKAVKDAVDSSWDDVRTTGGWDEATETYGIKIPRGESTERLSGILERQAKSAETTTGAAATAKMFTKGKGVADLGDYNREISRLKKQRRNISKGISDQDSQDLDNVIQAMTQDRKLALIKSGNRNLLNKIEAAEDATANYHKTYKRSVIGDLTAVDEKGISKIKSQDFVDNMLKRDIEEVDNFVGVIGDNPELMLKWKEGLADAYKQVAFVEGKYNARASNRFIKKHEKILSRFFDKPDIEGFKSVGKLHEHVDVLRKKQEAFKKIASNKWGSGKLSKLDPDSLVKFVTNDTGSWITGKGMATRGVQSAANKINFVKRITRGEKGAWQAFKNDFKTSLQRDLTNVETGRINPKKMAEWVSGKNKDTVVAVMGKNYYNDLVKINKVIQMLSKPMKKLAAEEARMAWVQTVRAGVAPPLTRRGRAFTALMLFDKKAHHKATIDALLDQKTMHEVAKLAEHNVVTRRVAEKAFSLGLGLPDNEEEFIRMQARMTLDGEEKDEMFEWVVAHNSVLGEVMANFRQAMGGDS